MEDVTAHNAHTTRSVYARDARGAAVCPERVDRVAPLDATARGGDLCEAPVIFQRLLMRLILCYDSSIANDLQTLGELRCTPLDLGP